jgi:hypothetical protein
MITTSLVSLFLLHTPSASAKDVFLQTMARYGKMDSFSTDIEHDNSSGLFPGKYKQHLDFKKGKGFKLVVTGLKKTDSRDNIAPDYYCDGEDVTTVGRKDGTKPLNKDPNIGPGYEVSGGLIVTWLLDSPTKGFFDKPPTGMKFDMDWGQRKVWHEEKVDEVVLKISSGDTTLLVSLFVDPDHKRLVGNEWTNNGKLGYMLYRNQKENRSVNPASFKPPK